MHAEIGNEQIGHVLIDEADGLSAVGGGNHVNALTGQDPADTFPAWPDRHQPTDDGIQVVPGSLRSRFVLTSLRDRSNRAILGPRDSFAEPMPGLCHYPTNAHTTILEQ